MVNIMFSSWALPSIFFLCLLMICDVSAKDKNIDKNIDSVVKSDSLEGRVERRWEAMINGDHMLAYSFLTPAYRKLYSLSRFKSSLASGVRWISVDFLEGTVEGERAEVKVKLVYAPLFPQESGGGVKEGGELVASVREVWLMRESQWWYIDPEIFIK